MPPDAPLRALSEALGAPVGDERLWREALTHPSFANEQPHAGPSYERLEFLGDAIVGAAVAQVLYENNRDSPPGELTFLRSVLVRREHLAAWGRTLPLESLIRQGKGTLSLDSHGVDSILADIAEALIAVVYLEQGMPAVLDLVRRTFAATVPAYSEARARYEPKNVLQERLAAAGVDGPVYEVVSETEAGVTVEVRWPDGSASAMARSKKEATVAAARDALKQVPAVG